VKNLTADTNIHLSPKGMDLIYADTERIEEWEALVDWKLLTGELEKIVYRLDVA